jgi:MFS transporter, SP family, galactose:H+ symporter
LAVLSVMLFGCFAISLGPLFWLAISQIYPLGVRGLAMGIATMTNGGFKLLVVLTFPLLVEALGAASTFWIYRAASVATLVFWHRFVPRRKGWSLEEIIVHWYRFR